MSKVCGKKQGPGRYTLRELQDKAVQQGVSIYKKSGKKWVRKTIKDLCKFLKETPQRARTPTRFQEYDSVISLRNKLRTLGSKKKEFYTPLSSLSEKNEFYTPVSVISKKKKKAPKKKVA